MCALKQQMHNCEAAAAVSVGMTQGQGRGLFASTEMKAGTTVVIERPLVAMQSLGNAQDVTVCRNCLGFVGDLISQLEVLSGIPRHECVARYTKRYQDGNGDELACPPEQLGQQLTGLYECLAGCGEVYCSSHCRSEHWERCHRLLCVGPITEEEAGDHPLLAFRIHAIQTNEIFLLVGEIMAQIATAFFSDKQPGGPQEILATARAPFSDFVQEPWWDVVVPRTSSEFDGDEEETSSLPASEHGAASDTSGPASFADTLRALCEESSGLLRRAFALTLGGSGGGQLLPAALEEALSAEMFSRVVGMFEQNNVGVRAPSPIPDLLRELLGRSSSEAADHGVCCRPHERVPKTSDAIPNRSQDILEEVAGMVGRMMHGEECDDRGEGAQIGCCGQEASGKCGVGHDGSSSCEHPSPSGSRGSEEEKGEVVENTASAAVVASKDLGDNERREEDLLAVIRDAVGVVDDVSDSSSSAAGEERELFAPLDGTALYSLICCMNHSCRPNCVVRYPGRRKKGDCRGSSHVSGSREFDPAAAAGAADPLVAEVLLLRDVAAGEELVQSYVTREMGLVERRMALQDYGFLCSCPQCVEEETARATSS